MTNKRSIFLFWALFLVPTLMMASIGVRLLFHEQERINQSAAAALSRRASAICETIDLTIEAVQENLSRSLLDMKPDRRKSHLLIWEKENPLVRNIFIYQKPGGLEYPVRGLESTHEERRFIARYTSLFSGRTAFDFNAGLPGNDSGNERKVGILSGSQYDKPFVKKKIKSSRRELVALSRVARKEPLFDQQGSVEGKPAQQAMEKTGWIPWFSENRLYLLGWAQQKKNGAVYGIELELMALLSRLVVDFPKLTEARAAFVIKDGNGNVMHQSGKLVIAPMDKPVAVMPVSSRLPHWQMDVFMDTEGLGSSRGFLYISLILVCIFIVAIITGGILLTRLTLQKMRDAMQKTSFVSSVSHELKTPLTTIRMYAELLLLGRIKDKDKVQTYLSVIVNESGRLTRLINNVLDFGKLEQGRKTYRKTLFKMDELLKQLVRTHGIRIKSRGLDIIVQVKEGDYQVDSDQDAMEQVILNIVDNALKYAGNGKFIKFILKREKSLVILSICDDGPGIPESRKEAVFEKFYRGDDSLTSQQPGSGLGLSISRQILRDLDADLMVEPVAGNGACFTIRITHYETH